MSRSPLGVGAVGLGIANALGECGAASDMQLPGDETRQASSIQTRGAGYTATVRLATYPSVALPVTVASSSAAPSLKTLSVASVIRDRLPALPVYPLVAFTASLVAFGSAICEVAISFETLRAAVTLL